MQAITRAAVAVIVLVAIVSGGYGLLGSGPASEASPTPYPALDTSNWTTYTSYRYGFSIGHPASWTERPADHTWTLANDADWLSTASEGFTAPGDAILATAWSVAVDPGTTADAWIAAYCPLVNNPPCPPSTDPTVAVTMDGHPGSLVQFTGDTEAFVLVGDRMYVVAVWEPDSDPRTAPYGGAVRLLEAYLSTVHLLPYPAAPASASGLLAYGMNDDIYLADQDGARPRMVAAGVPWTSGAGGGPSYVLGDGGPAWAPDGRHFLFFDQQGAADQLTGHIADASGQVVASIPNIWVDATWSPDSTRIEAWTGGSASLGSTQISIYGIDGALQTSLSLPDGYVRDEESHGVWALDGRSVYVRLGHGNGAVGMWQLPLDGSASRRLAQDDLIARSWGDVTFSPDGSRMAANVAGTISVANADGTDPLAVVPDPGGGRLRSGRRRGRSSRTPPGLSQGRR